MASKPRGPSPHAAARLYARAHSSDPFAYARSLLHIKQGIELASDIYGDAVAILTARGHRESDLLRAVSN